MGSLDRDSVLLANIIGNGAVIHMPVGQDHFLKRHIQLLQGILNTLQIPTGVYHDGFFSLLAD